MIIFNAIGVAPSFTGLLLLFNFMFPLNTTIENYNIEKLYFDEGAFMGVVLENNIFAKEKRIVGFPDENPNVIKHKKILRLTLNKGLFGFVVVRSRDLID